LLLAQKGFRMIMWCLVVTKLLGMPYWWVARFCRWSMWKSCIRVFHTECVNTLMNYAKMYWNYFVVICKYFSSYYICDHCSLEYGWRRIHLKPGSVWLISWTLVRFL
jgi:hypothetical protein